MTDRKERENIIVMMASDILESKLNYNKLVIEQFNNNGKAEHSQPLLKQNEQIERSIKLMRDFDGCW